MLTAAVVTPSRSAPRFVPNNLQNTPVDRCGEILHNAGVLTALSLGLWYGSILARLAILFAMIGRRIYAPCWFLFLLAHSCRSIKLLTLQHNPKGYLDFLTWTSPWMAGLAALAAIEAFIFITWKLPKFRNIGIVVFLLMAAPAVAVGITWLPQLDRAVGIGVTLFLILAITVFDGLVEISRGTLYHAATLGLTAMAAALSWAFFEFTGNRYAPWGSIISSGITLGAYCLWLWRVQNIEVPRFRNPGENDQKTSMVPMTASTAR
jgi:hypothetical protein